MRRLSFNRLAERELAEAAGYYEKESPGLGEQFLDEARSSLLVRTLLKAGTSMRARPAAIIANP